MILWCTSCILRIINVQARDLFSSPFAYTSINLSSLKVHLLLSEGLYIPANKCLVLWFCLVSYYLLLRNFWKYHWYVCSWKFMKFLLQVSEEHHVFIPTMPELEDGRFLFISISISVFRFELFLFGFNFIYFFILLETASDVALLQYCYL